jgi:LDH2 family malate/lactate/ureidoglycolate dehydrogenase
LRAWAQHLLEAADVPTENAEEIAALILRTEARGLPTHGISRMPTYMDKLKSGEYNPRPAVHVDHSPGMLRIDADGAMGQQAGLRAIRECLQYVETQPAVMCFARDLGHLGAVGMLPLMAAEQGYFALAIQRTAPVLGLPGSTGPLIGHSPIAFAAPVSGQAPLVFDMACSIAARGHVLLAAQKGQEIPEGWAVDADGHPTVDPNAAIDGMLLPVGGYKGLGIAMLGEILAGSLACQLADRAQLREVTRGPGAPGGGSAFFWVINPALVNSTSTFDLLVSDWTSHYLRNAGSVARLPGQRAAAAEAEASRSGIEVPVAVLDRLERLGQAWGQRLPEAI